VDMSNQDALPGGFYIDFDFLVRFRLVDPCQYWTFLHGCGFTESALRNLVYWLKPRRLPMYGFVSESSRAIITTWRTASYKPTKLGWLNSLSEQGSSVNRQRKKQACQRQVTLSSS
jgi:hypothetical protein